MGATLRKIANLGIPYDNKTPEQLLKDSVSALQAASQLAPHEPSFYNNLGLSQFECGEYENAIQNYDQAIKAEHEKIKQDKERGRENLSFYHKNLGLAYYHMQEFQLAMDQYNEAIRHNDSNADNYFNRGNVYQQEK